MGSVYAVDISAEQINIAEKHASEKGLTNIKFLTRSIFELSDLLLFDMIYTRFVIMHLDKPYQALQSMQNLLKSGGYMVCEEAANAVTCCYPISPAFKKCRKLLMALGEIKGLDFNLGEKLYSYFYDLKLKNIFVNFVQPILRTKHLKQAVPLLMKEIKQNCINNNLASEVEIDQLINDLNVFANDERTLVSFSRTTQIYGQKL